MTTVTIIVYAITCVTTTLLLLLPLIIINIMFTITIAISIIIMTTAKIDSVSEDYDLCIHHNISYMLLLLFVRCVVQNISIIKWC